MEIFKIFGRVVCDTSKANDQIDDTTDRAEQSSSKIGSAFKKIGTAVVGAFAVDKIKDFGINCINAAADASAASSQFSQVFGDMENQASQSLKGIADDTGIQVNRMKGSYTQIAAFAKTTGMDTSNALGLADRAMVAVADSAAFYDRSLEETTESLQSFLKGNYENDSALGLSCTEVTRNEAANRLYGKSFKDLSEAQKQLTLLQMVEDANKASGALGQAARESDTWTNQTGNLKQAWTDFQATLGKKALPVAVKTVKLLATGVSRLTSFVKDGNLSISAFSEKITSLFSVDFVAQMQEWGFYLKDVVQIFANNTVDMFASKISGITTLFQQFGQILQPIVETILIGFVRAFDNLIVIWNDVFLPAISLVIDILVTLGNTIVSAILPAVQSITDKFQELQQFVSAAIQNFIIPAIQSFIDMVRQLWQENQDKIQLIGQAFQAGFQLISGLVSNFVNTFKNYIYPFLQWLVEVVKQNMDNIKSVFQSVFNLIGSIAKAFIALFKGDWQGLWNAVKSILQNAVQVVKNLFNLLKSVITTVIQSIKGKVEEIFGKIKDLMSNKIREAKEKVLGIFDDIKSGIKDKIDAAKEGVGNAIEKIKSFFNFDWHLPNIPLPHFNITGHFGLNPPSIPHFSVDWYKKAMDEPYMFTEPTIFSMNPETGKAKGAGEAGDEVMIGKETMLNMIRQAVTEQNKEMIDELDYLFDKLFKILSQYFPLFSNMKIVLDTGTLVGEIAPVMDDELGNIQKRKERQ